MILGRLSMKCSSRSSKTSSPSMRRNFHAAPVVTTPKTGPDRSWVRSLLIRAAYIEAMHCPNPVRIRSFLASTIATKGARRTCSLPPLVRMKSQ